MVSSGQFGCRILWRLQPLAHTRRLKAEELPRVRLTVVLGAPEEPTVKVLSGQLQGGARTAR